MGKHERLEREDLIIKAAAKVFFIRGFEGTKVEDVAREAGLSKGSVYFYFKNKEDLYMALIYHALQVQIQLDNSGEQDALHTILHFIEAYFGFVESNPQIQAAITDYIALANPARQLATNHGLTVGMTSSQYYQKILDLQFTPAMMMMKVIMRGLEDGSIRNKADFNLIYATLWSMVLGYEKLSVAEQYFSQLKHPVLQYFYIDRSEWKKMIIQTARIFLTTENIYQHTPQLYENIQR
jgi:AcrR family transcriptional regulator